MIRNIKHIVKLFFLVGSLALYGQQPEASLEKIRNEFSTPTDIARTKLWWFHGETETTREGITADLEAFKREGVGGVVYYDQQHGEGENALKAFSAEWWDMFRFAAQEAKRLGLTFETHLSNGYVSGGPWITEDLSMQRIVAADTLVEGGKVFNAKLPLPDLRSKSGVVNDVAVVAFPVPDGNWKTSLNTKVKISTNISELIVNDVFFPKSRGLIKIPEQKPGESVYLNVVFDSAFTARSITYSLRPEGKSRTGAMNFPGPPSELFYGYGHVTRPNVGQLEGSDDGVNYTKICDLKPMYESPSWNQRTISFPATKKRYFRINLHDWTHPKDKNHELEIGHVVISSQAKMDQWEEKAALNSEYIEADETPNYPNSATINPKDIIDLTQELNDKGELNWHVPKGQWVIMRFVRVPIGVKTKHGRPNLMGLESDKLSAKATKVQFDNYFKVMRDSLSKIGISLNGLHMDSHEAGSQNWSPGYANKFKKLRGYAITKYLPALQGYIVGSREETGAFLHDMRLTLSDLVSEEYFGTLDSLCRAEGVTFTAQAVGNGLTMVADNVKAKGQVEKPQGEFWAYQTHGSYDVKGTSSAAHIYGKPIASAEAFTDMKFGQSLADMKNVADYAFAFGAQEFVVCASAYQPLIDKFPGSTGGGREYVLNRNNTYWNYSRPFWDYQARCAALMRNGKAVIDLCIYLGDNSPVKLLAYRLPEIPEGYDFDVTTEDGLITRMQAKDGHVVLPDGMSYQMLILERQAVVSYAALKKIASLVKAGVPVWGARPLGSGALKDLSFSKEYQDLVNQLWGSDKSGIKTYGKGKVYWGMSVEKALSKEGIKPDAGLKSKYEPTDKVYFAHRKLTDTDIYFLNNHSPNVFNDTIRFRTDATKAEYWDPVTGNQYKLPVESVDDKGLLLNLKLQPNESGFVVVSKDFTNSLPVKNLNSKEEISSIEGSWNVFFNPKYGGPGEVTFNSLEDWTQSDNDGIKFYSGTAIYKRTVKLKKSDENEQLLLRFPNLGSIAQVYVNGKEVSTVWCSPWEADITPFVKKGKNKLEIHVTNSLRNRMVGDASLPQEDRITYAYPEVTKATDRLVPSGIMEDLWIVRRLKQK
ncbi:glycosyl hydrolase [Mariniflexile sp. HNIBRBA6329]|uniref:glycosyl hydrolase n=1 Tax=Mariniflexile sp. HNIBRBA6329 TaxID=3373088 RepID=UPI003745BD85